MCVFTGSLQIFSLDDKTVEREALEIVSSSSSLQKVRRFIVVVICIQISFGSFKCVCVCVFFFLIMNAYSLMCAYMCAFYFSIGFLIHSNYVEIVSLLYTVEFLFYG